MQNTLTPHNTCCLIRQSKGKEQSADRKQSKILPHITKQFDFRIANRLLIQKIISPRRDKTIIDSLNNTSCKYYAKNKKQSTTTQSINYRRKILHDKCKQNDYQQRATAKISSKEKTQRQVLKQAIDNYPNFMEGNEDLAESKWKESEQIIVDTCYKKDFIGKIIRNSSNFNGLSTRRQQQNRFIQTVQNDLQTNQSLFINFLKSQLQTKEGWGRRLIRKNGSKKSSNKQNANKFNDYQ